MNGKSEGVVLIRSVQRSQCRAPGSRIVQRRIE